MAEHRGIRGIGRPKLLHLLAALIANGSTAIAIVESSPWLAMETFPDRFNHLEEKISAIVNLNDLATMELEILRQLDISDEEEFNDAEKKWLKIFRKNIIETSRRAKERLLNIQALTKLCDDLADIKFDFLFDKSQRLLAIGYNVTDHRRDNGF